MSDAGVWPTFDPGGRPTMPRPAGVARRLFGDRFELLRPLGSGGMGVVWLARDLMLGKEAVALKFLPEALSRDPVARRQLRRETARAQSLHDRGIVQVYDYHEDEERAGFSMEYVAGRSLRELLADAGGGAGFFEAESVVRWVEQICSALQHAHGRGVIHLDLKPANVMVDASGSVRVMDFGVARSMADAVAVLTGQSGGTGTLPYMSPQQLMGDPATFSDDVYALGATIYELLTGFPPFYRGEIKDQIRGRAAPTMGERRAELGLRGGTIPAAWEETVAACMAKQPWGRPGSVAEVWACLRGEGAVPSAVPKAVVALACADAGAENVAAAEVKPSRAGAPVSQPGQEMTNGIGMVLCWCPPGEYVMGSPKGELGRGDDEFQSEVELTRGFWMGKYPVTQGEYELLTGYAPSRFKGDARLPVESVRWNDAVAFCQSLTAEEREAGRLPEGWEYGLPTEAQWEYACRAGTRSALNSGEELTRVDKECGNLGRLAWYDVNSNGRTHAVGKKRPNALGLHDMHGNVWEWCADWHESRAEGGRDPAGPFTGSCHVIRGGSWYSVARYCRSAYRISRDPGYRNSYLGFRVALRSIRP